MKSRLPGLFACLLVALVGGIAFYLQKPPVPRLGAFPRSDLASPANKTGLEPVIGVSQQPESMPEPLSDAAVAPAQVPEYEYKIARILSGGLSPAQTAQLLIDLLPGLPPAGQAEAAQHICNLITDDPDYDRIRPLLHNPTLPQQVQDVFVTDLLNRADAVKLPTLLEIAKTPAHPFHEDAKTYLKVYLNGDQGADWSTWDAALKQYLVKERALVNGVAR